MYVTEFGISMEVKPVQLEKAKSPMAVTEFGISMEVKPEHPEKAMALMLVTEKGIPSYVTMLGIEILPEYFGTPLGTCATSAVPPSLYNKS